MRFWATEPTPGEIKVRHISSLGVVYFSKMYFMIFGVRAWESHKKNWGFQRCDGGLTQDIASFQPVSVSTRESIPMSSHALLLLEILLNLSFFLFRNNWQKSPTSAKIDWRCQFWPNWLDPSISQSGDRWIIFVWTVLQKVFANSEQTCNSTNFHIKYISHNCVKWVTSKYPSINWQTWERII